MKDQEQRKSSHQTQNTVQVIYYGNILENQR